MLFKVTLYFVVLLLFGYSGPVQAQELSLVPPVVEKHELLNTRPDNILQKPKVLAITGIAVWGGGFVQ